MRWGPMIRRSLSISNRKVPHKEELIGPSCNLAKKLSERSSRSYLTARVIKGRGERNPTDVGAQIMSFDIPYANVVMHKVIAEQFDSLGGFPP